MYSLTRSYLVYFIMQVIEVINADALVVKSPDGGNKKLFLSSLRPPRYVPSVKC